MTEYWVDAVERLLDDRGLDGPEVDSEALRQSTLDIPDYFSPRIVNVGRQDDSGEQDVESSTTNDPVPPRVRRSRPKDVVLICSGGGHLEQMLLLQGRLPLEGRRRWITIDSAQSRSLLKNEDVEFVPEVYGTNVLELSKRLARSTGKSRLIGSPRATEAVVSTGSGIALAYLPYGALRGIPTYYVESATCVDRPSRTGRALERLPGIKLLAQVRYKDHPRWQFCGGSVLDQYESVKADSSGDLPWRAQGSDSPVKKVFVSLGLSRDGSCPQLLDKLRSALAGPKFDVSWQLGSSHLDLEGRVTCEMSYDVLRRKLREADLVVAHACAGIAHSAIAAGRRPVLIVSNGGGQEVFGDGNQHEVARSFGKADLAEIINVDEITAELLVKHASSNNQVEYRPGPELIIDEVA